MQFLKVVVVVCCYVVCPLTAFPMCWVFDMLRDHVLCIKAALCGTELLSDSSYWIGVGPNVAMDKSHEL